jgi:aspartate/methionine/tyrosine aminotransferase
VLFTCGAQEANFLTFLSLLDDDSHAVVVTPTYQALHAVPESIADVTRVPLSPPEWELEVDAVADAVRPETDVIVVNNPNNPTGRYHPEETIRALYDLAEDEDAYLLCDEVYRLLAEDPLPPVASLGERGISTSSVTKSHGLAGLRFGWAVLPPALVETAWNWKDYTTISPSLFGQHVARQALGEREAEILRENREHARRNHERVGEFVAEYGLDWHDPVGVNGFVTVPEGFADGSESRHDSEARRNAAGSGGGREFCTAVVEAESVVLAPGDLFGHPDRFRIGFGLPRDELVEGLARVGRVIERRA